MLNARVIFKKETKEAMEKPISMVEKRRLRLEKLKELDEGGYLASATNRMDVGEMVGLPSRKQAYDWATREIVRGGLKETFVGFGSGNKPIYEYHYQQNQEKKMAKKSSKMSSREMFERLQELEKSGELKKAECRSDLVRLIGFSDKKAGYTWVVNWIRRGHIRETEIERVGFGSSAKVIARYSLTGSEPMFRDDTAKVMPRKKNQKPYKVIELKKSETINAPEVEIVDVPTVKYISIEITRGDLIIKLEMPDYEKAGELIKTILKGE